MHRKRTIVFIHGSSSSCRVLNPLIHAWKGSQPIIGIELPGHGNSAKADDYSWRITKKYLLEKINLIEGEILLIGNSVGGHLAIEIAPDIKSLKGLMILGAPPLKLPLNLQEAFAPNPYSQNYFLESPDKNDLEETFIAVVQNKAVIPVLREDFYKTDPKVRSTLWKDITSTTNFLDEAEIISLLSCKKYFINGAQDPSINFEYLDEIQQNALHPIETIVIDNCGHYPTLEQPEEFSRILERTVENIFA